MMKRTSMLKSVVCVGMAALLCSCAGLLKGPSDEDLVAQVVDSWKVGMSELNIDKLMATYSEDFETSQVPDKDSLSQFLEGAMESGYLDDVEVILDDTETEIDGETATVYPIDIVSAAGEVSIELTLTKEEGGWMITGMEIEGV